MKQLKCIFLLFWAIQITAFAQTPCDDINTALLKIDKLIVDGKLDQALTALKKIKNDPNVRNCDNMKVVEYKIKDIESKMPQNSMTPKQMYDLGNDYYKGRNGKARDYAEAVKWYRKAAEQGYAKAQSQLGYMYQNGSCVSQDYAEAVKWYRKAAEQGDLYCQKQLGHMYMYGLLGVTNNLTEAKNWYEKAAAQGDEDAKKKLKEIIYIIENSLVKVAGFVYDNDNKREPLIGVSVLAKNKKNGAITDLDGGFYMYVALGTELEFSYVGYKKLTMKVVDDKPIKVYMKPIR